MDKTVAGLIGAVTAIAAAAPSHAATPVPLTMDAAMQASSYADLLTPIPNALALLQAAAEASSNPMPSTSEGTATVQEVQYYHHHHHHHHHRRYRHYHHHHHHYY